MEKFRDMARRMYFWLRNRRMIFVYLEKKMMRRRYMPLKSQLGACGSNTFIEYPAYFDTPENVFLDEDVKIRNIARFVNSPYERITVKKYTVVGPDCMIISNNHQKTVGIPQFLLGTSHVHDRNLDTTIGEDVWIGARVTIMPGANIGRGCIVGACALVTRPVPPYSVVVGQPAHIIGKVFEKEDIRRHEAQLYAPEDRMDDAALDHLFEENGYDSLRTYGSNEEPDQEGQRRIETLKRAWRFVGLKSLLVLFALSLVSCGHIPGEDETDEESRVEKVYCNADNTFRYETLDDSLGDGYTDSTLHIAKYPTGGDTLRILAIGNSFSEDGTEQYLREIVLNSGIDPEKLGFYEIAKGKASINTWIDTYYSDEILVLAKQAGFVNMKNCLTLRELLDQPWDIIVIQQRSSYSYKWDTFQDLKQYLNILTDNGNRNVCIAYQIPWSHSVDEMPYVLDGNIACCRKLMKRYGIETVIPAGTAIQLARQTELNDSMYLTRDNWHLGYGMGRYIAACTWFESLVAPFYGKTIAGNLVRPDGNYTDEQVVLAQKCARRAVLNPFNYKW